MDHTTWNRIDQLRAWLDANTDPAVGSSIVLSRVFEIGLKYGDVAEALNGVLGVKSRRGERHTWGDVHKELCDVIVASMVALATMTPEARKLLDAHLDHLVRRLG